jgi:ribosomal-protein-alanine N-acetyltransferase
MRLDDVAAVVAIDQVSFPTPWSDRTYRQELCENPSAYLYVADVRVEPISVSGVIGYVGFWFIVDEAHISTIAVHPNLRRQGIGRVLLEYALERARALGAELVTLEVRESNQAAIEMYQTFGFQIKGRRRGYYRDKDEDALVMVMDPLSLRLAKARETIGEC